MRLLVILLTCLLARVGGEPSPLDQEEVLQAIQTQIEEPPEEDTEEAVLDNEEAVEHEEAIVLDEEEEPEADDDDFDVDFTVNRPTTAPEEEEEVCTEDLLEGDLTCVRRKGKDLTPYKKYKVYKKWTRMPLFVIIIGGLRWDYLDNGEDMKAFNWIKKHGTTMSQVVPVFPPYDLPTWTALATGMYPDNTGVLGDYMFNLKTRELFDREDPTNSLENWWVKGEPIWSVAAQHGRKVSVINWHDCTLPGKNIEEPMDCRPYVAKCPQPVEGAPDRCISNRSPSVLFNRAFTRIQDGYDLSIVYTDVLKKAAKRFGPNSPEVAAELVKLDKVLQDRLSDIKNKKERAKLKLNILLLSDYGLNGVNKTTKVVLDKYLNFDHVQYIIQRGGSTVLVPYALKSGDIMNGVGNKEGVANMIGINAYVRDVNLETPPLNYPTIPEDLNYAGLTWTQDILLVAKPGFEIVINTDSSKILPPLGDEEQGQSGYEPQPAPPYIVPGRDKHKSKELRAREKKEVALYKDFAHTMKTIGFAWGPDFKAGHTSEPLEIVDLYQLMAFLLKIPPNHHDGEWSRIRQMLMISGSPTYQTSSSLLLTVTFLLCLVIGQA